MKTLGAILAGGRSSRFGSDKALADWRGRPLIDHAIAALAPTVDAVLICGRAYRDYRWTPDRPAPDLGPLAGLAAALAWARDHAFDRVLTLPCDVPGLAEATLADLREHAPAYLAAMPVIGCWPAELSPALDAFLADGPRAVRAWGDHVGALALEGNAPANINRPADLLALDS